MSIIQGSSIPSAAGGVAPFNPAIIPNSIWLDGAADSLSKTFSSGSPQTKIVISTWVQRNSLGTAQDIFMAQGGTGGSSRQNRIHFQSDDTIDISIETSSVKTIIYSTTRVFRDVGWYHILLSIDQPQLPKTSQTILFVNGVSVPIAPTDLDQGFTAALSSWGNAALHVVGSNAGTGIFYKGYQAQTTMLVGKSIQSGDVAVTDFLDSFPFGTNGSQFTPKKNSDVAALASTAGGNSFCLDYENSSDLGNDISSRGNDFSPTSMSSANQSTNTPSLPFPILNVIDSDATLAASLEFGNRLGVGVGDWDSIFSTLPMGKTGKWYFEVRLHTDTASNGWIAAIHETSTTSKNFDNYIGNSTSTFGLGYSFYTGGSTFTNNSETNNSLPDVGAGDVVMMAVDLDNSKIWWGENGTFYLSGNPATGANPIYTLESDTEYVFGMSPSADEDYFVNFGADSTFGGAISAGNNADANGQGNFKHAPPTGFLCLCPANLVTPEFQGIDFFDATIYEGNGASQRVGDFVPFTDDFNVVKSAMFEDGDSRSLSKTFSATPTNLKKQVFSMWLKRTSVGNDALVHALSSGRSLIEFNSANELAVNVNTGFDPAKTSRVFPADGSWFNVVCAIDTTQGTTANRIKIFVNGIEQALSAAATVSLNTDSTFLKSGTATEVGASIAQSRFYDGYMAEFVALDGQSLQAGDVSVSSFGQLDTATNRWVPKNVSGLTFGTNGFYLKFGGTFASSNGAGDDSSGKDNDFTENGSWATTDQFIDTPTKNFATLDINNNQSNILSEGNTKLAPGGSGWKSTSATFKGLTSGKFYFEFKPETANSNIAIGIGSPPFVTTASTLPGSLVNEYSYYFADGKLFNNGVFTAYGSSGVAAGVVVGVAIDLDNNKIFFAKNNTFENSGNPVTGVNAAFTITGNISYDIVIGMTNSVTTANNIINFGGQSALAFTPPEGFVSFNQDDLDDTDDKLTAFAWIKNRDATDNHMLFDRVRGVGKDWHSNAAEAEVSNSNTVQRFFQRGVQVGNDVQVNTVNESYVLWQWLVGDTATTGTVNDDGSIDTTVITAASEHFSVGTYTGNATDNATAGHGLGGIPEMIIVKTLADAVHGVCWHKDAGGANTQGDWARDTAFAVNSAKFGGTNSTLPSSTVFKMGNNAEINPSSKSVLFYAFRSIPGVCLVSSYTGNGSSNGPYISTGFLPRWIMIKQTATSNRQWNILDTARYPFNAANPLVLLANTTAAGAAHIGNFDFLADGFKVRDTAANVNTSGNNYTYIAIADIGGNGTLPPIYGR